MKKIFNFSLAIFLLFNTLWLASCTGKETILIYATAEEERIAYVQEDLNKKFSNYNIVIQYQGTGNLVSKLQGEDTNTDCDIILELEANNMELLLKQNENFFYELTDYDFSQFTDEAISYNHKKYAPTSMTYGAVIINEKVLKDNNLDIPQTYNDLLDPKYKNMISMPNPKNTGTGYLFFNGLVSTMGEQEALNYFDSLNSNIKEFTSSGSAPLKAVNRGEVGIGLGILWQAVLYSHENSDLSYTFLDYGAPSNYYSMAIINGHEKKEGVTEVFEYIFYELNKREVEKFAPDPIYKDYTPEDPAYPLNVPAMNMQGLFDPVYKQNLLDKWVL